MRKGGKQGRKIVSGIRGFFSFEGVMANELARTQGTFETEASPGSQLVRANGHLFFSIAFSAVAQVFLKIGADQTADRILVWQWLGLSGLSSPWVWLGILCMILGFASWTQVLRTVPLNLAFAQANAEHVIVPLVCWGFLGESINGRRWVGIFLVVIGLLLAAKPLAQHERNSG